MINTSGNVVTDQEKIKTVVLSLNLAQNAATYDAGTVSGGAIMLMDIVPFVSVIAAGLVSMTIQTNNATPDAVLASTLLAALTAGKNFTPFTTRTYLPSGGKIQYTIVGTGSGGGIMLLAVRYQPLVNGALLS